MSMVRRRAAALAVALSLVLTAVLSLAAAPATAQTGSGYGPGSGSVPPTSDGSCGDGVRHDVEADGHRVASVHATPSGSCGASYDADSNRLDLDLTFDLLFVRVFVPVAGLGSLPPDHGPLGPLPTTVRADSAALWSTVLDDLRDATGGPAAPLWATWDAAGAKDRAPTVRVAVGVGSAEVGGLPASMGAAQPAYVDVHPASHGVRPDLSDGATADARAGPVADGGSGGFAAELTRGLVQPDAPPHVATLVAVGLLGLLGGVALYRRLRANRVLDHPLRRSVFDAIKDHPGITVQELSERLDVDYSTARHHADVLLEFDLVHRRRDGRIVHFFENHGTFGAFEKRAIPLLRDGTSAHIARVVHENPGIRPTDVARRLDVDPSTVKWHLDKLRDAELVDATPLDGRSMGLAVPEAARDVVARWV